MRDIRQTPQYANYLKKIGWIVERPAEINYFIKKVPVLGSVIKVQRPEEIRISKIRELAKKYRAFQIIIEPKTVLDAKFLTSVGFRLSKSPYLPTKTLQIDLTRSKEKIFKSFKKDARYALKKTESLGIGEIKSIEDFRSAWKNSVGLKRYVPPLSHLISLKQSFKSACVYLVYFDDSNHRSEIIGGSIFLQADGIAYYWQAFTNKRGRETLAQYSIVWEGILWAKGRGAKVFDFEGIYDERFPNKSWQGFTHFKKSFRGYEVIYSGCFVKSRLPL